MRFPLSISTSSVSAFTTSSRCARRARYTASSRTSLSTASMVICLNHLHSGDGLLDTDLGQDATSNLVIRCTEVANSITSAFVDHQDSVTNDRASNVERHALRLHLRPSCRIVQRSLQSVPVEEVNLQAGLLLDP